MSPWRHQDHPDLTRTDAEVFHLARRGFVHDAGGVRSVALHNARTLHETASDGTVATWRRRPDAPDPFRIFVALRRPVPGVHAAPNAVLVAPDQVAVLAAITHASDPDRTTRDAAHRQQARIMLDVVHLKMTRLRLDTPTRRPTVADWRCDDGHDQWWTVSMIEERRAADVVRWLAATGPHDTTDLQEHQ